MGSELSIENGFFKKYCGNETTAEGFFACIEDRTFNFSHLVPYATQGSDPGYLKNISYFKFWTWSMSWPGVGRCYTLDYDVLLDIDSRTDSLLLLLNTEIDYVVFLHEPGFFAININKLAMPTTIIQFNRSNKTGLAQIFTLEASRRTNLNRVGALCEQFPNYNFSDCVIQNIAKHIGCTLPWNRKISGGKLICLNATALIPVKSVRHSFALERKRDGG